MSLALILVGSGKMASGELTPDPSVELVELPVIAAALEHLERESRYVARPSGETGRRSAWKRVGRWEGTGGGAGGNP